MMLMILISDLPRHWVEKPAFARLEWRECVTFCLKLNSLFGLLEKLIVDDDMQNYLKQIVIKPF